MNGPEITRHLETITIADRGPGVGDADRDRLFGRFERGAGRPTGEGSGLGLYVSRELCRAMGGELSLAPSDPSRGASFTITLPAEAAEQRMTALPCDTGASAGPVLL